jgi:hypothetical protein
MKNAPAASLYTRFPWRIEPMAGNVLPIACQDAPPSVLRTSVLGPIDTMLPSGSSAGE